MLAEKSPVMKKATLRLMELSADEKARQLYDARLKEQRDIYAREQGAAKQKALSIAKNLLGTSMPVDQIAAVTDLTLEEVETLRSVG